MRSIRLSLIVYFLALLALALGGVYWFAYQTTAQTLHDKQISTRDLIQAQYEEQRTQLQTSLDRRIRRKAQDLAGMARYGKTELEPLYRLGVLATRLQPQGYLNGLFWLHAGMDNSGLYGGLPMSRWLHNSRPNDIYIEDADDLIPEPDPEQNLAQEYFQTYNRRGATQQRSESLGERSFALDEALRTKPGFYVDKFETLEPEPGWRIRQYTLKASPLPKWRPGPLSLPGAF